MLKINAPKRIFQQSKAFVNNNSLHASLWLCVIGGHVQDSPGDP